MKRSIEQAQERLADELMRRNGVSGVGIGSKQILSRIPHPGRSIYPEGTAFKGSGNIIISKPFFVYRLPVD